MLRAVVVWFVLWGVFLFLLKKLGVMKHDGANVWLPRVLRGVAAMVLASLLLAAVVFVF